MVVKLILFFGGLAVWCLLSWPPTVSYLICGILASFLATLLTRDMFFMKAARSGAPLKRCAWFLWYLIVFSRECLKANIDVAYRVLHPDLPIKPGMVTVKTMLKSETALAFLANSITLTPGTTTVDVDKEQGLLSIHWIYVKTADQDAATKLIVGKYEHILKEIFE